MIWTFAQLFIRYNWRPIHGCPGRYILKSSEGSQVCINLISSSPPVMSAAVPDPVRIALIPGGGLISYSKGGGDFLHTLNTPAGFKRKLHMLKLGLADFSIFYLIFNSATGRWKRLTSS